MTTAQMDNRTMLTTKGAADQLGVSLRTVQLWCNSGAMPCVTTVGGHRRISKDALARMKISLGYPEAAAALPSATTLDTFAARGDMVTAARAHALALPRDTPKDQVEAALDERLRLLIQRVVAADPALLQHLERAVMAELLGLALHNLRCCGDIDLINDIERLLSVTAN